MLLTKEIRSIPTRRETYSAATLSITGSAWTGLRSNSGLRSEDEDTQTTSTLHLRYYVHIDEAKKLCNTNKYTIF